MAETLSTTAPGSSDPSVMDRNALFGILALQLELLDKARFATAWSLWVAHKERSLGDLLVERSWLSEASRADVDRLVEDKVSQYQRDSTAGLEHIVKPEVRQVLAVLNEPELDSWLKTRMPDLQLDPCLKTRVPDSNGDLVPATMSLPAEKESSSPGYPGSDAGQATRDRFALLHLHASGGIGRVWQARDGVMGRVVALKELRPDRSGHASTAARFLAEARITGQLEHPGIVPVYELSGRPGDPPFYTMRFIKGQTLSEVIQAYHQKRTEGLAKPLDLRALLDAFVTVCNTLAYAHARGVIHRDLKGANVVVGAFGEVVVLDWGLAKVVGQADGTDGGPTVTALSGAPLEETLAGQVLGTPAYMPPEQAAGRHDLIDARSDVYGLGAILYEILTGRPPYQGANVSEVLTRVLQQPPDPPSRVCAGVHPALQAICLKALARAQADRYQSATELGRDVLCWLADEPVSAYHEPLMVRGWRWARRHRQMMTGVAALVLTALVALIIGIIMVRQEQVRTESEAKDKEEARAKAAKSFAEARALVHRYPEKLSKDVMRKEPGMQILRRDLAHDARVEFEKFVADQGNNPDPDVVADLGQSFMDEADITSEINPDRTKAVYLINQAIDKFTGLTSSHKDAIDYQRQLAACYNKRGTYYHTAEHRPLADASYRQGLQIFDAIVTSNPQDREARNGMALCLSNLGELLVSDSTQRSEAEACIKRALTIRQVLVEDDPDNAGYQRRLADIHAIRGELFLRTRRMDTGNQELAASLKTREALLARYPEVIEYHDDLAKALANMGRFYRGIGEGDKALEYLNKALPIRLEISKQNPAVTEYQSLLAGTWESLGLVYQDRMTAAANPAAREAEYRRARESFDKALAIEQELVRLHPRVLAFQDQMGQGYYFIGDLHYYAKRETYIWYNQAIFYLAAIPEAQRSPSGKQNLGGSYWGRALVYQATGQDARALADWKRALRHYHGDAVDGLIKDVFTHVPGLSLKVPPGQAALVTTARLVASSSGPWPVPTSALAVSAWTGEPFLARELSFHLACIYSLMGASMQRQEQIPLEKRTAVVAQIKKGALAMLKQARVEGLFEDPAWRDRLEKDPDLEEVRQDPDFKKLLDR